MMHYCCLFLCSFAYVSRGSAAPPFRHLFFVYSEFFFFFQSNSMDGIAVMTAHTSDRSSLPNGHYKPFVLF